MAMSKGSLRGESKTTPASVDAVNVDSILKQQQDEQATTLAQAGLYRQLIFKLADGAGSPNDEQAARILSKRWQWNFDDDLSAVKHSQRIATMFPDGCKVASEKLWEELTAKATELSNYRTESRERLLVLEGERQNLEIRQRQAYQYGRDSEQNRKAKPHLFGGDAQ